MVAWVLATAMAASIAERVEPAERCSVSAFWERVDESKLDHAVPAGFAAATVRVGCRFVALPGATVRLDGVTAQVVGIRRLQGLLLVAAAPADAALVPKHPVAAIAVEDGDWGALLRLVNDTPRQRP